jgi:hypothetical protein
MIIGSTSEFSLAQMPAGFSGLGSGDLRVDQPQSSGRIRVGEMTSCEDSSAQVAGDVVEQLRASRPSRGSAVK